MVPPPSGNELVGANKATREMSGPRISVVIPVRNEADKITHCLDAVFSQSLKPCEVIVVGGHSSDKQLRTQAHFQ